MHGLTTKSLFLFSVVFLAGAFAGAEEPSGSYTATSEKEVTRGLLKDERFSFKPLVGAIAFKDIQGNTAGRGAAGLTVDMNLTTFLYNEATQWYAGPVIGAIGSHMGDPTSNFFGTSATTNFGQASANLLVLPANLKVGYAFTDYYRLSAHGGGNVIYRSVAKSINMGDGSDSSSQLWKVYPNVGADLDIALSKKVAISLRPDWTLAPGNDLFVGSLGLGIFLG